MRHSTVTVIQEAVSLLVSDDLCNMTFQLLYVVMYALLIFCIHQDIVATKLRLHALFVTMCDSTVDCRW